MTGLLDPKEFDLGGLDDPSEYDLSGAVDTPKKDIPMSEVPGRMIGRFSETIIGFPGRLAATARSFLDAKPIEPYKPGQEPSAADDDELYDSAFGRMDLERRARVMTNSDKYFADGMTNRDAYRRAVMEEAEAQRQDAIAYFKEVEESTAMSDKYKKESSGVLEDIAGGLASGVTGVGAFFVGGPILSAAVNYSEMHGYKIQELEDLNVEDPNIKLRSAIVSAGLQTPLEVLSNWVAVSKVMKANGTWRRWLISTFETGLGEGAPEFVQQFPDEYATLLALNPDVPQKDLLSWADANKGKIFGEALYAGGIGAATGAIMGGAGGGAKIAIDKLLHPKQAQANAEKAERAKVLIDKAEAGTITPEEAAELGATSEEQIKEVVAQVKKNIEINKPIQTPQRDEVKSALSFKLGDEKAETEIQVFDALARSWADKTGNQPAQFYEDVVGMTAEGMPEAAGTEADLFQAAKGQKIFDAYQALKEEKGYSNIEIAAIRDKARVTQEEIDGILKRGSESGAVILTDGDYSVADEKIRSGAIKVDWSERPQLLARIDDDELFQSSKAGVWRSQMQDVLAQKLPGRADAPQMAQTIEAFAKKGEFKLEELEWSGVREWLAGKSGKVTKQEVQDYLAENNVQVKEVTKGALNNIDELNAESMRWFGKSYENLDSTQQATIAKEYGKGTDTVYSQYQLPGGKNYQELLLTMPQGKRPISFEQWLADNSKTGEISYKSIADGERFRPIYEAAKEKGTLRQVNDIEKSFASSHYQEPNILAHVRFNERVDADGKRVLFIEELQSDWAQKGRKEGFALSPEKTAPLDSEYRALVHKNAAARDAGKEPLPADIKRAQELEEMLLQSDKAKTPDAPFVKDTGKWSMLAMKRMVRYAAENDFDRIAWTPGSVHTGRWGTERISWKRQDNGQFYVQGKSQVGGQAAGIDLEAEGNARGLNQYNADTVASQEGLERIIQKVATEGQDVKKLTEKLWKRMQEEPEGVSHPRKEGFEGYYDKILPAEVNKFFGKAQWGNARVGETRISTQASNDFTGLKPQLQELPGARFRVTQGENIWQFGSREAANAHIERLMAESPNIATVHSLDITPQMQAKAVSEGMPLFQDKQGGKRGSIKNILGDGPSLIKLFESADTSTPIHEIGHLGVKLLFQTGDSDYMTLAEFAGVDAERATMGPAEWSVAEHEKIAQAFETYIMEGRSPTMRLQMAFAKLKQWLIDIYKSAKAHGVELSDEVRGVFDRLLTTDFERQSNAFAEVSEWVNVADLMGGATSAKQAEAIKQELANRALDSAAFAATEYDEIVAKARELAVAKVAKKRATQEKKLKAAFKKEAEAVVSEDPYYDMIDEIMSAGGLKYDNVLSLYSKDWIGEIQRARPGIISHDGRAYADDMAMQYNFDSADALLQEILSRPSKQEAVDRYYDSLVREYDSNLEHENAEIYAEALQNEIDIINRMLGKPKKDTKLKRVIKEKTGQVKTPELKELAEQFKRDAQVARNAWRKARKETRAEVEAKAKGEKIEAVGKERAKRLEKIAKLKLKQMEQVSALRDTFLEKQNIKKSQDIINKALHTKSLPPEYQAQIAQFVSEFQDVPPGMKAATEGKSLDQFLAEKRLGNEYIVDEIAIRLTSKPQADYNAKGYRLPMKADAWEQVADIVTMIKKMGTDEGKLLNIKGKAIIEDVVGDMQKEAYAVWGTPDEPAHPLEQLQELKEKVGFFNRLSDASKGYLAWVKRTDFIFDALQGYKKDRIGGKNFQIQNWIDDATSAELKEGNKAVKQLKKIFSWIKNAKEWAQQKHTIPGLPVEITKEDMIGIALHSQNKQNRTALVYGYGITEQQIDAVVAALSPREMQMVEDLWAFADQFYAPLNELHKNLTGAPLKKVEGKYWPLKPQRGLSQKAESFAAKESEQDLFAHAFSTPNVAWGSRHERTGMKIAPDLSLDMILRHTVQVLHDIHFQIPVRNANKIIAHPAYNQMVTDTMGEDVYKVLKPWLVHVARPNPDPIGRPERLFRKLRTNSTVVGMGLRVIQLFDQLSGITASIPEVGEKNILKAIYHVATSPREAVNFARENSAVMANLQSTWDRDLATFYDEFNASNWGGTKKWMKDAFFIFSTLPDRAVRYTVWHGAYMQGLDMYQGDLEKAVRHADTVTSSTQGTGMVKDLNTWLRGGANRSEVIKLFTMFQVFFSVLGNNLGKTWTRYRLGGTNFAEMVKAYMWLILIPALFSKIIRDRALPEDDEWYKAPIAFMAATLPMVRDVLSPWLTGYRYQMSPVAQAGEAASRLVKTALDPESDEWLYNTLRESIRLSGYVFGLPTGQAMTTMDGIQDLMNGETDDPTVMFWRSSKQNAR